MNQQQQIDEIRQLILLQAKAKQSGKAESTFYKQFYVYEFFTAALGVAASATDQVKIESDADFIWTKMAFWADLASAAQTDATRVLPNVSIQFKDTGSGRNFFNAPIAIPSIFGTGEIPFILPIAQKLRLNSVLQCDFTSFEAVSTPDIRLAIIGYKIFKTGSTPAVL